MMPDRNRDVVTEKDGARVRNGVNRVNRGSSGEKEEIARGSWDRDRDGGGNRDRDRGRDRENSRDGGRGRDSSRDIGRDRLLMSRASGGEREEKRQPSGERFRRYNDDEAADLRKKEVYEDDERKPMDRDRGREYDEDERGPMGRDRGRQYDDDEQRPMGRDRGRQYDDDEQRPMGRDRGRQYDDDEQRPMGRDRGRQYDDDELRPMGRDRGREYDHNERRPMGRDRGREYDDNRGGKYGDEDDRKPMGGGGGRGRNRGRGWGGRGRGGDTDKPVAPPVYSILKATVHSIRPFGIFVEMEGYRNHGLVHLSQVSDHEVTKRDDSEEAKVKALSSVASEGEQVWIKVISVKVEEDGSTKIGCSMKYVSQGDGEDLDPNNIQAEKQQSRPAWKEPHKFKLEAVYNVQCERCGGHGHLKKECYSSGEKTYKLLTDDEDAELTAQNLTKNEEKLPRESSKYMQSPKPLSGISNHLLATGSVGRGRAVVQPAWMKHGIGVGGPAPVDTELKQISALPEKPTTVEEALAVISMLTKEKHRRKEEHHREKDKRHRSKDEKKEKRKKRHREHEDHKERHSSRKKHRDVEESDGDDYKEHKKHRDDKSAKERKKHREEKDSKERHKKRRDVEESDEDDIKERKKVVDVHDSRDRHKKHRDEDYKGRHSRHRHVEESDEEDTKMS